MKNNVRITLVFVVVVSLIASALGITVKFSLPNEEVAQEVAAAETGTEAAEQKETSEQQAKEDVPQNNDEAGTPVQDEEEHQPENTVEDNTEVQAEEVVVPVAEEQVESEE